jgi:hypothetical protein
LYAVSCRKHYEGPHYFLLLPTDHTISLFKFILAGFNYLVLIFTPIIGPLNDIAITASGKLSLHCGRLPLDDDNYLFKYVRQK